MFGQVIRNIVLLAIFGLMASAAKDPPQDPWGEPCAPDEYVPLITDPEGNINTFLPGTVLGHHGFPPAMNPEKFDIDDQIKQFDTHNHVDESSSQKIIDWSKSESGKVQYAYDKFFELSRTHFDIEITEEVQRTHPLVPRIPGNRLESVTEVQIAVIAQSLDETMVFKSACSEAFTITGVTKYNYALKAYAILRERFDFIEKLRLNPDLPSYQLRSLTFTLAPTSKEFLDKIGRQVSRRLEYKLEPGTPAFLAAILLPEILCAIVANTLGPGYFTGDSVKSITVKQQGWTKGDGPNGPLNPLAITANFE